MSFPIPVQLSVAENNVPVNVTLSEQEGVSLGVSTPIEHTITQAEWQALMNDKADIIISSATGEIASFPDGANNLPVVSLAAGVNPAQDLHGYSKPWAAGAGKNLLDSATVFADTARYTVNADESVTVLATNGQSWTGTNVVGIPLEAGTYTFYRSNASGSVQIRQSSNNYTANILNLSNNVSSGSFTLTSADTIKIKPNTGSIAVYPNTSFFQLELSSTASDWTPYENICPISGRTGLSVYVSPTQNVADATTYAVDWTAEAGTVYGGTVNLATGALTVDRVIFETTWSAGSNATVYGDCTRKQFSYTAADDKSKKEQAICNVASYITNDTSAEWAKGSVFSLHNSSKLLYLSLPTSTPSTQAIQLCYYLATPVTYQLTAQEVKTLLGQNYVWSNNGGVIAITYRADTKLYIDNKIAQAIAAAL